MSAILAFLGSKLGMASLAGGGVLAGWLGPKMVSKFVASQVKTGVSKMLDLKVEDPKKKAALVALVKQAIITAEVFNPDRGQGETKKEWVLKTLGAIPQLPGPVASALGAIVQEVFDSMDDELKEAIKGF